MERVDGTRGGALGLVGLLLLISLTAACGKAAPVASADKHEKPPSTGIVGRWERTVTCPELTSALTTAGLGATARYAWPSQTSSNGESSFAPGSPTPTRARPCTGALARSHEHFFDAAGSFGSLDWLGGQVDDGTYQQAGSDTLRIGAVTFRFRIVDGNTLFLTPELTPAMVRTANTHPDDYSDAAWAVSVAYPGHAWKRVPCDGRC
ncbi:MAG: hypothetical protein ACJ72L_19095 [Marmoricola sp.]